MPSPDTPSSIQIGTIADWVAAIATFLAVLVALFKDEFLQWRRRPVLRASIRPAPPDCAMTSVRYQVQRTALTNVSAQCLYLRLWISNEGQSRADKVQVFAASLSKRGADNTFKPVESFLPMNFTWSHATGTPEVYAEGISPHMGKHCDVAHILEPSARQELGEGHPDVPNTQTLLALDLEVKPYTGSHLLPPGEYKLTLRVAAANCAPRTTNLGLNVTGSWFPDERRMLSDGVGVSLVDA